MGYMRHDAIVVTSWHAESIDAALQKARGLGLPTTPKTMGIANCQYSFLIAPDGSQEGWRESELGDDCRRMWKSWVDSSEHYVDYIHVSFGGDEKHGVVVGFNGDNDA